MFGKHKLTLQIQAHCPYPIEVLHIFAGRANEERPLHRRFSQYRERGEWFRIAGDVEVWLDGGCRD